MAPPAGKYTPLTLPVPMVTVLPSRVLTRTSGLMVSISLPDRNHNANTAAQAVMARTAFLFMAATYHKATPPTAGKSIRPGQPDRITGQSRTTSTEQLEWRTTRAAFGPKR